MRVQVILLEDGKYGMTGEVVSVAGGFARNYLLPRGKALRATSENKAVFESKKAVIEAENIKKAAEAQQLAALVKDVGALKVIRQSSEDGRLYGSVTTKDIADALSKKLGTKIGAELVLLHDKIRAIGVYSVDIALYSGVVVAVSLEIVRA